MAKDPRYMSFDHQYVETVTVTDATALANGVERYRLVKRSGAYASGGGYAAGYFSYKWAEVLAADAYEYVASQGGAGSQASLDFLTQVLQVGGSLDFMSQYIQFRGKEPGVEALLKASGIGNN